LPRDCRQAARGGQKLYEQRNKEEKLTKFLDFKGWPEEIFTKLLDSRDIGVTQAQEILSVAEVLNPQGAHPVVLVCEHASAHIPEDFGNLGLSEEALVSHIAWDPGALTTARALSALLDAPLIHATISRLVYDLNRPPDAASAMPAQSEATPVPGNVGLDATARTERVEAYYQPWSEQLSEFLEQRPITPVVVTIHSFTPTYLGKSRAVEVGILHDEDARLADAILASARGTRVERNQPYGPEDGVMHTLQRHALPRGWLNVMIEIRNDLIKTNEDAAAMALQLSGWLDTALASLTAGEARA
jgi:predicted N-formylglutamate amidohydrolase